MKSAKKATILLTLLTLLALLAYFTYTKGVDTYYVNYGDGSLSVEIPKGNNHSLLDIALASFGKELKFNTAIIKTSDVVESTDKAFAKMSIDKDSWSYYNMKNGCSVYFYQTSNRLAK